MKANSNHLAFKADYLSGLEGTIFALSCILEAIRQNDLRNRFHFPFYGLTINQKALRSEEWIDVEAYTKISMAMLVHIEQHGTRYFDAIANKMTREAEQLRRLALRTIAALPTLTDTELARTYDRFMAQYLYSYGLGCITFLFEHVVSEMLHERLQKKHVDIVATFAHIFSSDYTHFLARADAALTAIKTLQNNAKREVGIKKFLREFFMIRANYADALVMTKTTVLEMANSAVRPLNQSRRTPLRVQLSPMEKRMVALLRCAEIIRDQRKKLNITGSYTMFRFLDQLVARTGITRKDATKMFWHEFAPTVLAPQKMLPQFKARRAASIVYKNRQTYYLDYIAIAPRKNTQNKPDAIHGIPAAAGFARGTVKIISGSSEFGKMKRSDILVTQMTRPDFLPIMKLAGAIVTDEGGLTAHAAVVARELGIPCIVGCKNATKVLQDGDLVEADAGNGIVKKL